jgi:uncharacterized lipoprotein YehR (DUF1307 family)
MEYQRISEQVLELSKTNFKSKVLRNYRSDVLQQLSYGKFGKYSKEEIQSMLTDDEKNLLNMIGNLERMRIEDEKIYHKVDMEEYPHPHTLFFKLLDKPNSKENPKSKKLENVHMEVIFEKLIP